MNETNKTVLFKLDFFSMRLCCTHMTSMRGNIVKGGHVKVVDPMIQRTKTHKTPQFAIKEHSVNGGPTKTSPFRIGNTPCGAEK